MHKSTVHAVHAVFKILEKIHPAIGDFHHAKCIVILENRIPRQLGYFTVTQIGKNQTEIFPNRITEHPNVTGKLVRLCWLLNTLAIFVIHPAVIKTADAIAFYPTDAKVSAPVFAARPHKVRYSRFAAIQCEVLA
jgi:hypothetical protein